MMRSPSEIQLVLESTYEGIYSVDNEGVCTLVNRAACAMFLRSADQLLGTDIHALVHHHDSDPEAVRCPIITAAAATTPQQIAGESFWRSDGSSFPAEIFVSPIPGDDGIARGVVVSFIDATEKNLLRDELERANRLSSLGRLAATMLHDFNNVLMAIQPFAEIIRLRSQDERVTDAARHIIESVQRGRGVTQEMLRFTRPSQPAKDSIDAATWLSHTAAAIRPMLPATIDLELSMAEGPLIITADRGQISQILTNIVISARDAMGEGGGRITVALSHPAHGETFSYGIVPDARRFAHLSVADNGPGIAPSNIGRFFEPFFTAKKGEAGLGLAIAHQIVSLHGGHVFVESTVGRGTAVHVFLPLAGVPDDADGPRQTASRSNPSR
jgi:hypothetical protein